MKDLLLACEQYLPIERLKAMCTKQLLNHYRASYSWYLNYDDNEEWEKYINYRKTVKSILDTREHIYNKAQNKKIRKAKKKKGQKKEKLIKRCI